VKGKRRGGKKKRGHRTGGRRKGNGKGKRKKGREKAGILCSCDFFLGKTPDEETHTKHTQNRQTDRETVAALHHGAPGQMTWLEYPPPWLRLAYCFASVIV